MPSTATITAFFSFSANTTIRSAQVNTNFSNFRGHIIPIEPLTATSASLTYDLGSTDYPWRILYNKSNVMYQHDNTTTSLPANPPANYMSMYFKNDGTLYVKNPAGTEGAIGSAAGGLVPDDSVTFAKMQNIATQTLIGRYSSGTGDPESVTIGNGLVLTTAGALSLESEVQDSLELGERTISDLTGIIVLGGWVSGSSRATLREPNGSAGYVVPTGSSLQIYGVSIHAAIAASAPVTLAYSDNDVGFNSATGFTGASYLFGDSAYTIFRNPAVATTSLAPGKPNSFAVNFTVPQNKYVGMLHSSGGGNAIYLIAWGKLV